MPRASYRWLIVPATLAGVLWIAFPKWVMDDAFIVLRFAQNFARYGKLIWNVGQPPVEGYTGVFLPVYEGLLMRWGFSPVGITHALGLVSYIVGGFLMVGCLRRLRISPKGALLVFGLYCGTPIFYTNGLNGLETMFYTTLVLAAFAVMFHLLEIPRSMIEETGWLLLLLLAALVRPEGVALALICASGYVLCQHVFHARPLPVLLIQTVLLVFVPLGLYFLWRHQYYGYWLPNTYYAKKFPGLVSGEALIGMLKMSVKYFAIPVAYVIWITQRTPIVFREHLQQRLGDMPPAFVWVVGSATLFVGVTLAQYSRSILQMGVAHRFLLPFFPLMLLALSIPLDVAIEISRTPEPSLTGASYRWAGTVLLLLQVGILGFAYRKEYRFCEYNLTLANTQHIPAGQFLKETMPSGTLITVTDAGATPFFSELPSMDLGALCNAYLAHHPKLPNKEFMDYVFGFHPGAIVETGSHPMFMEDSRFRAYTLAKRFTTPGHNNVLNLYVRTDLVPAMCSKVPQAQAQGLPVEDVEVWCVAGERGNAGRLN